MRERISTTILTCAVALAVGQSGCGGENSAVPHAVGATHGGFVNLLPNGSGFVESLAEPVATESAAKGKAKVRVVAYFLDKAGSGPLNPLPTDVSFKDVKGVSHSMIPKPDGDAQRFETEPFEGSQEATGEFSLKLGSESVSVPVRSR